MHTSYAIIVLILFQKSGIRMDNYERVNTADRDTVIYPDHHRKLEWCVFADYDLFDDPRQAIEQI